MTTTIECVITVNGGTYSPGPADASGSCAQWPGSVPTPLTYTGPTTTTSTTTTAPASTQPAPGSPGACSPSGYAGCSGGGLNAGAGTCYTGCSPPTTGIAATTPVAPVPVVAHDAVPLAFTGAPIGIEVAAALLLVGAGAALRHLTRKAT